MLGMTVWFLEMKCHPGRAKRDPGSVGGFIVLAQYLVLGVL